MHHSNKSDITKINVHLLSDAPTWEDWKKQERLMIDQDSWHYSEYRPLSEARLMVHQNSLLIRLSAFEPDPLLRRAVYRETGGPVHLDSCLEAFLAFADDESEPYFNFEFNSLGTAHVAYGPERNNRRLLRASELAELRITCLIDVNPDGDYEEGWWQIHFRVPSSWLELRSGHKIDLSEQHVIRANFYKCGDETKEAHYLSWGHIQTEKPDFHRPEYFKRLEIVKP